MISMPVRASTCFIVRPPVHSSSWANPGEAGGEPLGPKVTASGSGPASLPRHGRPLVGGGEVDGFGLADGEKCDVDALEVSSERVLVRVALADRRAVVVADAGTDARDHAH